MKLNYLTVKMKLDYKLHFAGSMKILTLLGFFLDPSTPSLGVKILLIFQDRLLLINFLIPLVVNNFSVLGTVMVI